MGSFAATMRNPMPFLANDLLAALPRLRRYARVLTDDPDRADELVKETITRTRQNEPEYPSGASVAVRLFSILRSVYVDEFAPGQPRGPAPTLDALESRLIVDQNSTGDASESNAPQAKGVLARLSRLPLEDREVLVLVAVERMSYDDIATLLGVPLATVLARLTQARDSFRSDALESMQSPKNAR